MNKTKDFITNLLLAVLFLALSWVFITSMLLLAPAYGQNVAEQQLQHYSQHTFGGVPCERFEELTAYQRWLCANQAPEVYPACPAKPDGQVDYACMNANLGYDNGVYVGPPPTWPREVLEQEYRELGEETRHSDLNRQGWQVRAEQAEAAVELLKKRCGRRRR